MAVRYVNIDHATPMLFPPYLHDWVSPDHIVHFIMAPDVGCDHQERLRVGDARGFDWLGMPGRPEAHHYRQRRTRAASRQRTLNSVGKGFMTSFYHEMLRCHPCILKKYRQGGQGVMRVSVEIGFMRQQG